jgi:hypothetical protein
MGNQHNYLGPQGASHLVKGVDHRVDLIGIEQGDQLGEMIQGLGQLAHGWFKFRNSKLEVTMG